MWLLLKCADYLRGLTEWWIGIDRVIVPARFHKPSQLPEQTAAN